MLAPLLPKEYGAEFKTRVVTACRQGEASIAGIALVAGVNANRVHRWIRAYRHGVVWADREGRKYVLHADEFKRAGVAQCGRAGATVTSVVYSHSLRPALVHRWIQAEKRKQVIPASSVPPADDGLPVVVSEEGRLPETKTKAGSELHSSPVGPAEAIDIEFSGAHLRIPMGGENFFGALRVILEHLK